MIAVHHVLRGDAFLLGADGDGPPCSSEPPMRLHLPFSVAGSGHKCQQEHKRLPRVSDMNRAVGMQQCEVTVVRLNFFSLCYYVSLFEHERF